jgi:hypothetical protein
VGDTNTAAVGIDIGKNSFHDVGQDTLVDTDCMTD